MSSARLRRLTETLDAYVREGRLAGGVALVARHGRIAFLHAFGQRDREAAAPMREDTIFRIASHTKAVVSVAALMLQEEGRLRIDDPVARYLPQFAKTTVAVRRDGAYEVVDAARPITIRDLLTHTSGLPYGRGVAGDRWSAAGIQGFYFADRDEPMAATVGRMAALPFDAQPGETFVYGYSTDVLGVVVERASGLPLDHFLRARLFEPLGMRDTHFYLPPEKAGRLAAVYSTREGGSERAPTPGNDTGQGAYVTGPRKSFSGGAGLLSTAGDYARFLQMMLAGGELDGVRILRPRDRGADDARPPRRGRLPARRRLRPRLLGGEGPPASADSPDRWASSAGEAPTTRSTGWTRASGWWSSTSPSSFPRGGSTTTRACARWSTRRWWTGASASPELALHRGVAQARRAR